MRLGAFMMPLHPPAQPSLETLREDQQAIQLADRLGDADAIGGKVAAE